MKLAELHAKQAVAQGRLDAIDATLVRWLNDLRRALGFDHRAPMFDGVAVSGAQLNLDGSLAAMAAFVGSTRLPSFPDAVSSASYFGLRLPNSYRSGTAMSPFVDWAPSSAAAGNVVWELEVASGDSGDTITATTSVTLTSASPGTANKVKRGEFDDIDGTALNTGTDLVCRLSRLGGDAADTYAAAARVISVGFKYQRQGVGNEAVYP